MPCIHHDWISPCETFAPGAVGQLAGAQAVEHLARQAARIGLGLEHQRRHRRDQAGLGDACGAVAADITRHFAAARRKAEQHRVPDVQVVEQLGQVVGVVVHVVAVPRLARAAVAAAVVGDAAVALAGEEDHLRFPAVRVQRPTVAEHDGLAAAPVLVIEFDAFPGGVDGHVGFSLV
jgi:hypothetical protein